MTMLDRRTGPDERTVAVGRRDFRRRRLRARLRRIRPWLVVVLLVAVAGTGGWLVYFSGAMTVTGVQVTGNRDLSSVRVEAAARVPQGEPLARVDLAAIEARVETIAAVRDADVSRSWPHTVRIDVTERVPVAVVTWGEGNRAVDDEGALFHRYQHRPPGLPLIRTEPDVRTEALAEAAHVIASLPGSVAAKVDYLDVASVDRISLLLRDGRRVQWGSAEQSEAKAEVLDVLLRRTSPDRVTEIDVSVPARPTTR
jgi:cell division protein FtsQ